MSEPTKVQNEDQSIAAEESATPNVIGQSEYTVTVNLKYPIQYGAYKQSFIRAGIAGHEFVSRDKNLGILRIWTGDRYIFIPYGNIISWTIHDNQPSDDRYEQSEPSE